MGAVESRVLYSSLRSVKMTTRRYGILIFCFLQAVSFGSAVKLIVCLLGYFGCSLCFASIEGVSPYIGFRDYDASIKS